MDNDIKNVPFNRPKIVGSELEYIQQAVALGQLSGDGSFTIRCQALLEERGVAQRTLLTHSCTAALEMAMILADVGVGDEVIMPSFTFVSTANAVCLRGATPIFVDIDPVNLCLDPNLVESAITAKTKAVIMVHYAGLIAGVDELKKVCSEYGLVLVEDAAQALGSSYKGQAAGSLGDLSAFSFHETKNVISGEGGFLGVNNSAMMERAEVIREKGTNRSKFFRGEVDKYTWVDIGSSYLPGELVAAFLYAQLEKVDEINDYRLSVWQKYHDCFAPFLKPFSLQLPEIPKNCEHNAHMYFVIFPSLDKRTKFIEFMREEKVMTPFHYVPLHSSPAGKKFSRTSGELAVTDYIAERLVRMPLYLIDDDEQQRVISLVTKYFSKLV